MHPNRREEERDEGAVPTISEASYMMDLLQFSPSTRAIIYIDGLDHPFGRLSVAEVDKKFAPVRVLAWLSEDGSARQLLDAVKDGNAEGAPGFQLCYGPHCSTWVLSEPAHPAASIDRSSKGW